MDLLILIICLLVPVASRKIANLYCRCIDEMLVDISNAVNGNYKSKYNNAKEKVNEELLCSNVRIERSKD